MILRRIPTPSRHGLRSLSRHFSATPSFWGGNAVQGGSYPYPLWYHPEGTVKAVSFLGPSDVPGKELRKEGIIGWVKGDTETPDLKPGNFQRNPTFEDVLHEVVKEHINKDEGIKG
ncbi:hypothetical protein SpCBS45565_g06200 [Spizellomyces sp. 'palustris']|nr:hypothetical protein SpCBS45565_g06200 [Spizellomyces sp. 'palustris']